MSRGIFKLIDIANDSLPVEQAFLEDLKISIVKDKVKHKPSTYYKPSSMVCIRNMYYQRTGTELGASNSTSELEGILESGSDRHERIQQAIINMKKNGFPCEYIDVETFVKSRNLDDIKIVGKNGIETKCLNTKYDISFLTDGIIKYRDHYYVLEIKTETSNKHWRREEPEDNHKTQATAYSLSFGINDVIFLYENRDNCSKKTFLIRVTPEMKMERVVGKIESCEGYVKRGIVPPKCEDKKACQYCNYLNQCRKDG